MDRAKVKKLLDNTYVLECFICHGSGAVDEGIMCIRPASSCCGGCISYSECTTCSGSGELEAKDDEMLDQFMMLRAIDNIIEKFKHIKKTFKAVASEDLSASYELAELDQQVIRYRKLQDSILTEIRETYD